MAATAERTEHKKNEAAAPQRLLGAGPRRWRWLALGAALMALGAAAVAAALGQVDQRSGMVAAAQDLPAGHVLAQDDLQVVEIAGGEEVAAIPAGRLGSLVGQTVQTPIGKNALIAPGDVGTGAEHPNADEAVVGASLAGNQVPSSLQAGAQVALVITVSATIDDQTPSGEDASAGAQGTPAPPPPAEPISARVQTVTPPGEGSGRQATRVELVVDASDAEVVARAASADALTVVEVAGGER
ncbi:SAF domain-containing protein [Streptomonospora arabica]|uniref:SAF domain-containing protein n=1 Tax=Streptomonospora arabica TaxID=412417 RepID=A0ABV9SJH5_9ACTN